MGVSNPSVRTIITDEAHRVAAEQKVSLGPLGDDAPLAASGLDSLGFAILVARLEERLAVDPFSTSDEVSLPVTFGDLVRFYERALA